jgi:sulfane dehydrogenase subunit SoxC
MSAGSGKPRRRFLAMSAGALVLSGGRSVLSFAASAGAEGEGRVLGSPRRRYGERAPTETAERAYIEGATGGTGSSRTPLQSTFGIITPSSLHFERHHSGVPALDPQSHELLIHGLVGRPLSFKVEDLLRFPSVSAIHFIECAGNSWREHEGRPGETPQDSHGLISCSEWTGVRLSTLLGEVGLDPSASWVVAEGGDASRLARSIPLQKALDDVLVAYGQNGEALRPEQGYPIRLLVPGWEGNVNVKWLRRLQVVNRPAMTKDEAATYTDFMPGGHARQFSFEMDVKSVITRPCGGEQLTGAGFYEIVGLAWSGRGKVTGVEVSVDGGREWRRAALGEPVLSKAFTMFRLPWKWDGRPTSIRSRAMDDFGDRQPTREELIAVRGLIAGPDGFSHYNGIKIWHVQADGSVTHV